MILKDQEAKIFVRANTFWIEDYDQLTEAIDSIVQISKLYEDEHIYHEKYWTDTYDGRLCELQVIWTEKEENEGEVRFYSQNPTLIFRK